MLSTFSYFCTSCKHTGWASSLFDCFAISLCNKALHYLYFNKFLKMNSFFYQFSRWGLSFLKIRLTSAEIRIFETAKSLISEQTALAAVFYFGQVFVFCRLISKNVLGWFLLIMWHTLNLSTEHLVEAILHCVFD